MHTVESAQKLILQEVTGGEALSSFMAKLPERAMSLGKTPGMVLAQDVCAKESIPFWDNSAVDGYAVSSRDVRIISTNKPAILKVCGSVFAGDFPKKRVSSGETIKIMTGAPLPSGADAVVMQEFTEEQRAERSPRRQQRVIKIFKSVRKWENVRRKGEDVKKGSVVLKCGTVLTPPALGLCASLGFSKIRAIANPKIAIFSTGNELIPSEKSLKPGKIRDSNIWILNAMVQELGLESQILGIAKDNPKDIQNKLEKGFQNADIVVSSGGVSVGEADHVQDVLKKMGAKIIFWKVSMKPGKPFLFAMFKNKPFFGLPGNPVSVFVTFHLFVKPTVLKFSGKLFSTAYDVAGLSAPLKINSTRRSFLRGVFFRNRAGKPCVQILSGQGSHQLAVLARANCLVDIPAGKIDYSKGKSVKVLILNQLSDISYQPNGR